MLILFESSQLLDLTQSCDAIPYQAHKLNPAEASHNPYSGKNNLDFEFGNALLIQYIPFLTASKAECDEYI